MSTQLFNLAGVLALGAGANYIYNNDLQTGAFFLAGGVAIHLVNYLFDSAKAHLRGLHGQVYFPDKTFNWTPGQGQYKTCKTALDKTWKRVARLVIKPGDYARQCGKPESMEYIREQLVEKIKWSGRILEKLSDVPGIVRRYDFIETTSKKSREPKLYLYEEFYSEGDLLTFLERHELSKEQQVDLILQLLTALAGMHARGVIHGDLKTENILVRVEGKAIYLAICDFDDSWMKGAKLSQLGYSPLYLSPERARSCVPWTHPAWLSKERWTQEGMVKNDLWATGLILYAIYHQGQLHPLVKECVEPEELFIKKLVDLREDPKRLQCPSQDPIDRLIWRLMSPRPPSAAQALEEMQNQDSKATVKP